MNRTFIGTPVFTHKWQKLGLTDEDLRNLQNTILEEPKSAGDVIPGTGGLRKICVAAKGHEKRGARVIYVDIEVKESIYLLNVYGKNEKKDLTPAEKNALKAAVIVLQEE